MTMQKYNTRIKDYLSSTEDIDAMLKTIAK